jgi:SAM-dependent methyltransferase
MGLWLLWQTGLMRPPFTSLAWLAGLEGIMAAALSWTLRLPIWWLPMQLLFVPLLILALRFEISPYIYLCGFILLWLIFRSNLQERVPLYLSNRMTWEAVAELLPRRDPVTFIDLGCGLGGGLLFLAKRQEDSQFLGVESSPLLYGLSRLRLRHFRNSHIRWGDFWDEDLSRYDVVYAFLSPDPMPALWRKAKQEMRPGSIFISNTFEVPGMIPDKTLVLRDRRQTQLLVWRM